MSVEMTDLHLHYKFTDRGGAKVYDAFMSDDRLPMKNRLFEIRIKQPPQGSTITETPEYITTKTLKDHKPMDVCFKNQKNIICKCSLCKPGIQGGGTG